MASEGVVVNLREFYIDRTYSGLSGLAAEATMYSESADVFLVRKFEFMPRGEWLMREVFDAVPTRLQRWWFRYLLGQVCREGRVFPWGETWAEAGHVVLSAKQLPRDDWVHDL